METIQGHGPQAYVILNTASRDIFSVGTRGAGEIVMRLPGDKLRLYEPFLNYELTRLTGSLISTLLRRNS